MTTRQKNGNDSETRPCPAHLQVKKAYRRAALQHHPDKNPGDKEGAEERWGLPRASPARG